MKIYTKTGDKGKTSLFDGTRVSKTNHRVATYGTIDELNSLLGVVISFFGKKSYEKQLKSSLVRVQDDLLHIGALLANPTDKENTMYFSHAAASFEKEIDEMTNSMPPLRQFILPGGKTPSAFLQLARAVSRRVERKVVSLSEKENVSTDILVYFNRLSDLLFTMARFVNFNEKYTDVVWRKKIR
ncbi:MAG: cob(I)yrinic acid a,c-diamide adenosyltransferase [Candidatus Levyibacteriota bacterium]